jgi:carboxyl-terminal processing protease
MPGKRPVAARAPAIRPSVNPIRVQMATMDPEPIPTEPTTDSEPPDAGTLATGPSLASASPAAGRGRGPWFRRAAVALALVLTFSVGIGVGRLALPASGNDGTATPAPTSGSAADFGLIREAWDTLHTKYVGADQLDDKALIYGAIDGMTQAVGDTGHTSFLTPEERAERSKDLSGKYVGIGVRIDVAEDGLPLIIGVFDGSPAAGAGLKEGDEIVAVDGKPTAGHEIDEIVSWVRGESGTTVKVTVRTGATGPAREVSMVRADVAVAPVSWTLVPGTKTALIRLDQFSQGAADDLKRALDAARKAGADRLILDLRGNPGGYVNEADAVASQFLKSGIVFIERAADGHETKHPVAAGGVATDLPLVVLVDGGTASSSEIVSGAIQDAGRAQIIGIKTFGTGTVLGEFPLSDGSALRVGTVEWLTPDGRRIWHEGITPDVVVERASDVAPLRPDDVGSLTPAQVEALADPQLARALTLVTAITTTGG